MSAPPSLRKHSRKQGVPSRAPLSGNEVILASAAPVTRTLPPAIPVVKTSKKSFKKFSSSSASYSSPFIPSSSTSSSSSWVIGLSAIPKKTQGQLQHHTTSRVQRGKAVMEAMNDDSKSSDESVTSSWIAPRQWGNADASTSTPISSVAKRRAQFRNEPRAQARARWRRQNAQFDAKWKDLKQAHRMLDPGQMADVIRGLKVGNMTQGAISRRATKYVQKAAGDDYHSRLVKQLSKKNNLASLYRFRERIKPTAQRRRYNRKVPSKIREDTDEEQGESE